MKYNKIIALSLVALLMVSSAEAQVSVRRQSRNKQESTEAPSNEKKKDKEAAATMKASAKTPKRSSEASAKKAAEPKPAEQQSGVVKNTATKKKANAEKNAPAFADGKSLRQRNFDEYQKETLEETPWQHVLYREIDMTIEQNASLYFPVEPQEGLTNLFRVIIDAYSKGELKTYEYLGDREAFTDKYVTKPQEVFDKFEIPYRIEAAKGRNAAETYAIDEIDVPCTEILSYYVKERWEFDQQHSRFVPRILCICPVLHRAGEAGDGKVKYPMFWINFEDLRPFLRSHLIVSSGMNDAPRYNMEEFFTLYQYDGTIYKEQNLRGLTLQQQYPNPDSLKMRQREIDEKLKGFGKQIWVNEDEETEVKAEKNKKAKADETTEKQSRKRSVRR